MKKVELSDIKLHDIGNTIQLVGAIYSGKNRNFLCLFPEEHLEKETVILDMDLEDWEKFLRQTDLMETEILEHGPQGITKAIVRKTQRQIDAHLMWEVFRRDNYRCVYCGREGIPLTTDHLVLWEDGGSTVRANLVSCCRKCNRTRGNLPFDKWLESDYYKKVSENTAPFTKDFIGDLWEKAKHLKKVKHIRSR